MRKKQRPGIKDLPFGEKPAERVLKNGVENLSNIELLSLILWKGFKGQGTYELAKKLLVHYKGNLKSLFSASIDELINKGIGLSQASRLKAVFELHKRMLDEKDEIGVEIKTPEDVFKLVRSMKYLDKEQLIILCLNSRNRVIGKKVISVGSIDTSIIDPREVFRVAILKKASSIILVHNHPSGDPEPSEEDIRITRNLSKVGKLLGIKILDHLIVGNDSYKSLRNLIS